MTVHLSVAARRAALLEHAHLCSEQAAAEPDPLRKRALLRDARDMMARALALESEGRAA